MDRDCTAPPEILSYEEATNVAKQACSGVAGHLPYCRTSSRKAVNTNYKAIDLNRLESKPESTVTEAGPLSSLPSDQSIAKIFILYITVKKHQ